MAQVVEPQSATEYELLLWLVALIPGFLLAYHRGWRGAATGLAVGMAVLSTTQAVLLYLGRGVQDVLFLLGVVGALIGVSVGIGWVTELLHRARESAAAAEGAARASEARAHALAERLEVVAQAAVDVVGARDAAALGERVRAAAARVIPLDAFQFQLWDEARRAHASGDAGAFPTADAAAAAGSPRVLRVQDEEGGARLVAHVPVVAEGRVLAVISAVRPGGDGGDDDLRVLDALAASAAGALLNMEASRERDAAGEALRRSEARFRSLTEDASELVLILDPAGRIRYASPAVARLVGYRAASVGRRAARCLEGPSRGAARAHFAGLLGERGGGRASELRVRVPGGAVRTLEVRATNLVHDPAVGGVVVNARDVTGQREALERLRESEHRYRRFFENDLTGDYLADARGTIVECNLRFAEIFAFPSPAAARGASLRDLLADGAPALDGLCGMLRREGRAEAVELRMCARDESEVHVVKNAVGIFDEHGELAQIVGYVFDVTEHRRTEEVLRHSQKLEAVGLLAAGVAHDFNNMLTAILGFASLLAGQVEPESRAARYAGEIRDAALRASELTHQLLAFGRRQVLEPRMVDPDRAVAAAGPMLRRLLPEGVELRIVPGGVAGSVRVDPVQFQQVLMNLVVNARDAMPGGGEVVVSTRAVELSAADAARVPGAPGPGAYVVLSVRDTGCGMDAATQRRIFEPFFTTKGPGRGTGLGLSTVHGIVLQSGGAIQVDSAPGAGATFTLLFPRHDAPADAAPDAPGTAVPVRCAGTVVLAEDEEAVRRPIRLALEEAGFTVLAARDGEEALRLADAHAGSLDLLVTDAVMPRMGGLQLAEALRRRQPGLGVVVVSGYADSVPDGVAFLQKPVHPARLIAAMREAMVG
jgi:PAS domain S-box-containing protein